MPNVLDASRLAFANNKLQPLFPGGMETIVVLPAGGVFLRGTILGQFLAAANDVQTLTETGTPTGGSTTIGWQNPLGGSVNDPTHPASGTFILPFNASSANLQTLLDTNFGTGLLTAGGGPFPGTPLTVTGAGKLANTVVPVFTLVANALTGGATPTVTIVHTTIGRSAGTSGAYASGNADGTQVPKLILAYPTSVDVFGRHWLGAQASSGSEFGRFFENVPAWRRGTFRTTDLVGLDANALTVMNGDLISGTLADGVVQFH